VVEITTKMAWRSHGNAALGMIRLLLIWGSDEHSPSTDLGRPEDSEYLQAFSSCINRYLVSIIIK